MLIRRLGVVVVLCCCFAIVGTASARDYRVRANLSLGTLSLDINQKDRTCSGIIHFTKTTDGEKVDNPTQIEQCTIEKLKSGNVKITFIRNGLVPGSNGERRDAEKQTYTGWSTDEGDFVSGYFDNESGIRHPWSTEP